MKTALADSPEEQDLQAEYEAYQAASSLQGTIVPKLLAFGKAFNSSLTILATQLIKGSHLQNPCSQRVKASAMKSLQMLHDCGLEHGDVSEENVIVTSNSQHVWLIDLHKSRKAGPEALQAEQNELELYLWG